MPDHADPFGEARRLSGVLPVHVNGETIPLVLRLQDVRKAANDCKNFSSDHPFKVVLHTEENLRSVRQLPIETDPPDHTDYRKLVEPMFRRPMQAPYQEKIATLTQQAVADALASGEIEAVHNFALPLQSRALTHLLGMPAAEAETWIKWGIHVFHPGDGSAPPSVNLEEYVIAQFARAIQAPSDDFFSILNAATFRGRPLSLSEKMGYASVAFAGGRDTIIHTVSSILAHLGDYPAALDFLRADEARLTTATEEYVRYVSPLTAIARTCPQPAAVADTPIPSGSRIGLCWPSANRDESVFSHPHDVLLDRKPNPHVGFGFGPHNCLGAPHARLLIRSLLKALCDQVHHLELVAANPKMEHESTFTRQVGYEFVRVRFVGR